MVGLATLDEVANKRFDFIIVAGGTAGSCLAARLSEDPQVTVALLEAGAAHFDDPLISSPEGFLGQLYNPEYDWQFTTVPQRKLDGRTLPWNRGKGLGGSSGMNVLIWTRPQKEDFDAIEELGNPGWNWEKFYHYSKKSERFSTTIPTSSSAHHEVYESDAVGLEGPVSISFSRTHSGTEIPFQKSLENFGIKTVNDALSGETSGTFKSTSSIDAATGNRSDSATSYLRPVIDRPNLKVLTGATATRVLLSRSGEKATAQGVEFDHGGVACNVHADKEVILCASGIKSPQLLELSGIGNPSILQLHGIPVQVDLPSVGENVQDHICFTGLQYELRDDPDILTGDMLLKDPELRGKFREMHPGYEGFLALATTGLSFLPSNVFSDRMASLAEEQQRKLTRDASTYPPGLKEQYEKQIQLLNDPKVPNLEILVYPFIVPGHTIAEKPRVWILPILSHPFSRGSIHIASPDPTQQPASDPRYFEEDIDFEILFDGTQFARKVAETEPFKGLTAREVQPGPDVTNDDELRDYIKKHLSTIWHACGSCSMLPRDKGGVVDTSLKVYGTNNLRVVDLSVLPLMVAVHTQVIVYGIAEQAADIIKTEHNMTSAPAKPFT
ncbi:hypothetical protein CERSUDRAFT_116159 [Gelatoporia subvermispora B]|uniref:Glucose-methanol-choline oxidoreductase N-terminal domain-containing protein n=1 Tax=Ceriporiopsis subvermispora (strain B) TaxID=914234 RepID=M2RAB1_CERS8|nr:hypothetical protein CERSUDRAFT_116159 [Gelatoporia subvermispora B]